MTGPLPGSAAATAADLAGHSPPLPAVTRTDPLTRPVAGSGHPPGAPGNRLCVALAVVPAATATAHAGAAPLILILAGLAVTWAARAYWWPFARCRRCQGTGKNAGSNGKRWGRCRKCKGSGSRQRWGSRRVHRAVTGARKKKG
ncbi:MAG TPA: hypothetical protein VNF47_23200 [Streptosporangiaceae bacterium]|nr:hypothetical protein [Streptosporangiaceae bacterium]